MIKNSMVFYNKIVPKDSFIGKYMQYMNAVETPIMYDFWSAVWIMSSILGRDYYIDKPSGVEFLNFYIIFLADSGIARKSTAVNKAFDIYDRMIMSNKNKVLINSTTTVRDFVKMFTHRTDHLLHNDISVNVSEFITFFKQKSVLEFFTDMYDCPTKRSGYYGRTKYEFNNVFMSLLCASSPSYYFNIIKDEQLEGGFSSRAIILPAFSTKRKECWGVYDSRLEQQLVEYGTRYTTDTAVQITISKRAVGEYKRLYRNTRTKSKIVQAFQSREHTIALKLSGILAINRGSFEINEQDIKNAYKVITKQRKFMSLYLENKVIANDTDTVAAIEKVKTVLIKAKNNGIRHSALYNKVRNKISKEDFNLLMDVMHEMSLVDKYMYRNSTAIIYICNKNTQDFDVDVVDKCLHVNDN